MANNAKDILKPAMQIVDHEPNVDKCYAEIDERSSAEAPKRDKIIEDAQTTRKFLAALGHGLAEKSRQQSRVYGDFRSGTSI